jgi:hypothetical protein
VQAAINATPDDGSGVNSLAKLQTVANNAGAVVNALTAIHDAAQNDSATGTNPSVTTYVTAGVTGVTAGNLAALNSALNTASIDGSKTDTAAKVQAIVNDYNAILASADGTANNTTPPLTAAQYTDIGVTGAPTGNGLSLLDNVIDGKPSTAVDAASEVQALADAANAVVTGAAAGTAPTLAQLVLLGVTGVSAANLAAVQAAINATPDDGSGVNSLAKLQTVATNAITPVPPPPVNPLTEIHDAAQNDSATTSTPSMATYASAGVSGVTAGNLASINSALNSALIDGSKADTVAHVQVIVDAYKAILASADGVANTTTQLTGDQYAAVGVSGIPAGAPMAGSPLALLDSVVDVSQQTAVATEGLVQAMATAAGHVMVAAGGSDADASALTLADLGSLGINTAGHSLAEIRSALQAVASDALVDSFAKLQTLITNIPGNHSTLSSNLNGVTDLDVTSNLVLTSSVAVRLGTSGMIHIHETGGAGYAGAITPSSHDVDIDLSTTAGRGLVTIDATGTQITINPTWDLDLGANYTLSIDAGAFVDQAAGTTTSSAVNGIGFSTVTPGFHGTGHTVAQDALASQIMQADGTMAASKLWASIQDIGNINSSMADLGSLGGNAYALVVKNYATVAGGTASTGDGVALHDTNVSVTNFGSNDVLYIDNQANNAATQSIDLRYSSILTGGGNHGGTADQTILSFGTTSNQSYGTSAIALGFENNSTNQVFHAIYDVGATQGFATFLHSQPVIAG